MRILKEGQGDDHAGRNQRFKPLRSVEDTESEHPRSQRISNDSFKPLRSVEDTESSEDAQGHALSISFKPLRSVEDTESTLPTAPHARRLVVSSPFDPLRILKVGRRVHHRALLFGFKPLRSVEDTESPIVDLYRNNRPLFQAPSIR